MCESERPKVSENQGDYPEPRRKTSLMKTIVTCLSFALALAVAASAADRPNIIYILADDLGWTDLGCQGSKYYETPNIDKLAADGLRFTNGYTCGPHCQPT